MKTKELKFNGKLFKKVRVGKTDYNIYKCSLIKADGLNHIGFINYTHKEIYIKDNKHFYETLRHELIHAYLNELYKKTRNKTYLKLRSNEFFIESLRIIFEDLKKLDCI